MLARFYRCVVLALALFQTSMAWGSTPMNDFSNIALPETLSVAEAQEAMMAAGLKRGWVITPAPDGTLDAHITVRTHQVSASIVTMPGRYAIVYRDSVNLQYAPNPVNPDRPLIHSAYNRWVRNLSMDIQEEVERRQSAAPTEFGATATPLATRVVTPPPVQAVPVPAFFPNESQVPTRYAPAAAPVPVMRIECGMGTIRVAKPDGGWICERDDLASVRSAVGGSRR
jgi:hypothetical protein